MYRLGDSEKRRRPVIRYVLGLLVIAAAGVGVFAYFDARRSSQITKSSTPLVTGQVQDSTKVDVQTINEPLFTINIPKDYKETGRTTQPEKTITWQGTGKLDNSRSLTVYTDTIPAHMPLNRLLPISSSDGHIVPGEPSDNCSRFVGPPNITPEIARTTPVTPAKWQGITFLCDLPNYVREVAGTGSTEAVNSVSITGPQAGKHSYFFVYTDHGAQPDFSIFRTILTSFQAK